MKSAKTLWRVDLITSLEAEDAAMELAGNLFKATAAAYFNIETGVSIVAVYLTDKKMLSPAKIAEAMAGLEKIRLCGLDVGLGKVEVTKVKQEDWAESWKKHFKAIEIGKKLLVKPSWIKKSPRKNQEVIILDPGLSFGTGQHATTSFCLGEIVRLQSNTAPKSFLDIGTGSGILAIAAAKLGYRPVKAFDFDPESVRVATTNLRANGVTKKIQLSRADITKLSVNSREKFDLVCANLIANLLLAEKRRILNRLNKNGTLVLAGILTIEFHEVQAAFEKLGMKLVTSKVEKEWCSGSFCFA